MPIEGNGSGAPAVNGVPLVPDKPLSGKSLDLIGSFIPASITTSLLVGISFSEPGIILARSEPLFQFFYWISQVIMGVILYPLALLGSEDLVFILAFGAPLVVFAIEVVVFLGLFYGLASFSRKLFGANRKWYVYHLLSIAVILVLMLSIFFVASVK